VKGRRRPPSGVPADSLAALRAERVTLREDIARHLAGQGP
jgi:hypothetical protein